VCDPLEVGVDHGINGCVRRTFLCGWDPLTQRSYEYRKTWLQQRLILLVSVMAMDIEGFCMMANHLHLISSDPHCPQRKSGGHPMSIQCR